MGSILGVLPSLILFQPVNLLILRLELLLHQPQLFLEVLYALVFVIFRSLWRPLLNAAGVDHF